MNLWGFGPTKQPEKIPDQAQIDDARARTGLQHLTVINQYGQQYLQKDIPDLFVDLSTVGEGYAADHLAALMSQEGISRYLVSVGGALVSRGIITSWTGNASLTSSIRRPVARSNIIWSPLPSSLPLRWKLIPGIRG